MERKGLGRGLSALMADVNLRPEGNGPNPSDMMLPIEKLQPNPHQPRKDFDPQALQSLADSLRQKGVIQPLVVRPIGGGQHEIVAGERRWRAAQLAGLHDVPVVVRDFSETEVLEIAIIENIQREDLNAIEEAMGLQALIDRFGHTQEKVAEALSKSRSHVANLLRLLVLPDSVKSMVREGKLSAGHARALIGTANPEALALRVASQGLSVRETEKLVRNAGGRAEKASDRPGSDGRDADTRALEADLSAHLGLKVQIHLQGQSGQVSIGFKNLDDLDRLCQRLTFGPPTLAEG